MITACVNRKGEPLNTAVARAKTLAAAILKAADKLGLQGYGDIAEHDGYWECTLAPSKAEGTTMQNTVASENSVPLIVHEKIKGYWERPLWHRLHEERKAIR